MIVKRVTSMAAAAALALAPTIASAAPVGADVRASAQSASSASQLVDGEDGYTISIILGLAVLLAILAVITGGGDGEPLSP